MARSNRSEMAVVADGKEFWSGRVAALTRRGLVAMETGDLPTAQRLLARAQVAQRALDSWNNIEERNIAAGMVRADG